MSSLAPTFTFSVTDVPKQTFAFVVRRVEPDQIGEFVTGALERVAKFAALRDGVQGPPMSVSAPPDEDGGFALEVGFPVAPGTRPEAPIEVRTLPATRAFVHRHAGPYEDLDADFYADLYSHMQELGYTAAGAPREVYLGGPYVCVPVTEVVWPIASS
jgi:effector-binding domain-containing protein